MSNTDWFRQGKEEKLDTPPKKEFAPRFWLKKGESAFITFCDKDPIMIYEHELKINGKWGNNTTCMKNIGEECPLCENEHYAPNVAIFTVIDHRKIEGKNGKVYENEKRLYVLKSTAWAILEIKKQKLEDKGLNMKGACFEVTRTKGDKSPNVGDVFDYEGHVEDMDIDPLDYAKFLAPDAEWCAHMAKKAGKKNSESNDAPAKPNSSKPNFS